MYLGRQSINGNRGSDGCVVLCEHGYFYILVVVIVFDVE